MFMEIHVPCLNGMVHGNEKTAPQPAIMCLHVAESWAFLIFKQGILFCVWNVGTKKVFSGQIGKRGADAISFPFLRPISPSAFPHLRELLLRIELLLEAK